MSASLPSPISMQYKLPGPASSWMWLPIAGGLLMFANGRNNVAIAAWLAPVFLIRFIRGGTGWRLMFAYFVATAAWAFQFRGMVPAPQPILALVWFAYAAMVVLPYTLDRVLAPRLSGFLSTFPFPCAAAGLDYLFSLLPYASWGSAAYTQYGILPLMQLASITGIYGITFLIAWFAAVVNWAWGHGFEWPVIRRGAAAYAAAFCVVLFYGGVRLLSAENGPTVRVASLTVADIPQFPNKEIERKVDRNQLNPDEILQVRDRARLIDEDLLKRAAREADAGAKIVFWGEGNSFVLPEDEQWLLSCASDLARSKHIYLGLGNVVWHYGQPRPLENTFVLVDPNGKAEWKFLKVHPVPGGEAAISVRGDGRLRFSRTPFGYLSSVICFDADSVQLLHQAGRGRAGLVLVPSNDWRAIDPWHTQMAVFRAIEQGFNMVRHASKGLSIAVDSRGRVLGAMDHYRDSGDRVLVAEVPGTGTRTIYARVGDLFSWMSLAGLGLLCIRSLRRAAPTA